jgi:hypothetical protein
MLRGRYGSIWRRGRLFVLLYRRGTSGNDCRVLLAVSWEALAVRERKITYPFIPVHVSEAHRDVVGSVSEWTVWVWLRGVHIPIGSWRCGWPFEFHGLPYYLEISIRFVLSECGTNLQAFSGEL